LLYASAPPPEPRLDALFHRKGTPQQRGLPALSAARTVNALLIVEPSERLRRFREALMTMTRVFSLAALAASVVLVVATLARGSGIAFL